MTRREDRVSKRSLFFAMLLLLSFISGCASTEPRSFNMKVEAVTQGSRLTPLESAYSLVSNMKGSENVIIIYDASGSMLWPTAPGGEPRYRNAYKSLAKYLDGLRGRHNVGLMVYGSRYPSGIFDGHVHNMQAATRSCIDDIQLTVPLDKFNRSAFRAELLRLAQSKSYRGDTPIGGSVAKAAEILKQKPAEKKHIILITDGAEECYSKNADKPIPRSVSPESAVQAARENGVLVSIVAFGVGYGKDGRRKGDPEQDLQSLRNLATGVFVVADTGDELLRALMRVEVEAFKLNLLDVNAAVVASFSLGETFKVDSTPYATSFLKKKMKFSISARGERNFVKDIGVDPAETMVNALLRLKNPDDTNPEIDPASLRWVD